MRISCFGTHAFRTGTCVFVCWRPYVGLPRTLNLANLLLHRQLKRIALSAAPLSTVAAFPWRMSDCRCGPRRMEGSL